MRFALLPVAVDRKCGSALAVVVTLALLVGCSSAEPDSPSSTVSTTAPAAQPGSTASEVGTRPPCAEAVPTITTQLGQACGTRELAGDVSSNAYLGMPYAEPPIGELRWEDPVPAKPWTGTYPATDLSPVCAQPTAGTEWQGREDCLYINVWTPEKPSSDSLPVMLYIPGGGFITGSGTLPSFNGTALTANDVIVATINYRLGPLGFMRHTGNGNAISGNFGIKDQLTAMQWVHANISGFGGDPTRVTLFGESAGAISTQLHLFAIPASSDLFQAAIMESTVGAPLLTADQANVVGQQYVQSLCDQLNLDTECPRDKSWLQDIPIEQVMQADIQSLPKGSTAGLVAKGMANGVNWFPIQTAPVVTSETSGYQPGTTPKPFVIGFNLNEGALFSPYGLDFNLDEYRQILEADFGADGAQQILEFEDQGKKPYNPASYEANTDADTSAAGYALAQVIGDFSLGYNTIRIIDAAADQMSAADLPAYGYRFVQDSTFNFPGLPQCIPEAHQVCHTDELPYVFNTFYQRNPAQVFSVVSDPTSAEKTLGSAMSKAWTDFAKDPRTGWPYPPSQSGATGPYVEWGTPIGELNDMGDVIHFDLWNSLSPTVPYER